MIPCSKQVLVSLFYNSSSSFFFLLLFLYFASSSLLKFINFIGSFPLSFRIQSGGEYVFSDEEEDDETYYFVNEASETSHRFAAHTEQENESLERLYRSSSGDRIDSENHVGQQFVEGVIDEEPDSEDQEFDSFVSDEQLSVRATAGSESEHDDEGEMIEQDIPTRDAGSDSVLDSSANQSGPGLVAAETTHGKDCIKEAEGSNLETDISGDERFLVYKPTQLDSKRLLVEQEKDEIFSDTYTVGSTSKSSSEWRSSIKDSGTDDPFSSSSRRSCPKWESYTVFQKYDEEMMFLDRICTQKLHETESLKSIQVCPRSISDRIVHKLSTINKKPTDISQNPYRELEATYVAQICLTWEALNWNYKKFQGKRASQNRDFDPGCPATIAQQFQQFQVLLQRYVENEPYEQGRRPEIYTRMRLLAPKLLLVPEYRDSEDDQKEEGYGSRISSTAFLVIMEDGIRTFMNFLKADKIKPYQVLATFFKRNGRGSVDPALLNLMKKVNKKKKTKLKDLKRSGKCIRKKKLKEEEEMEILMGLIDLKVVSRVLRMSELSEQQLHWCEEKMSKVRVMDGKLKRDSTPLFFPSH